jgi:hypothetical protein
MNLNELKVEKIEKKVCAELQAKLSRLQNLAR